MPVDREPQQAPADVDPDEGSGLEPPEPDDLEAEEPPEAEPPEGG